MKTVLICNQKGGVGKTLIANELAFAFERDKVHYNFFDLDGQGSSIIKSHEDPEACVQVIDTPGALQPELKSYIKDADFIIVPTMLSRLDMKPLERMIEILLPYKDEKPILFVFNRWDRFNATKDFIAWFNKKYPELKTTILCDSTVFKKACSYGVSIHECDASHIGCKQIDYIYNSVKYELNIKDEHTSLTEGRTA
jgi:chromosome partitioning protein